MPLHNRSIRQHLKAIRPIPDIPAQAAPDRLRRRRRQVTRLPTPRDRRRPQPLPRQRHNDRTTVTNSLRRQERADPQPQGKAQAPLRRARDYQPTHQEPGRRRLRADPQAAHPNLPQPRRPLPMAAPRPRHLREGLSGLKTDPPQY